MGDPSGHAGFLHSFQEIYAFFNEWLDELASRFNDETALMKPKENVNHALWVLGHITWLTDALLVEVSSGNSFRNQEWDELFKIGSERFTDGRYPSFSEVLDHYRKVKADVKNHLEGLKDDDLARPCLNNTDWFPTPLVAMLSFLRDGNYHLGQMSYLDKLIDRTVE